MELFPYTELLKDIAIELEDNPIPTSFNGVTQAFNAKSAAEVDTVYQTALAHGAKEVKKPVWGDWGGYSGYFSDINGYYWEVAYSKDWEFDDNDMLVIK